MTAKKTHSQRMAREIVELKNKTYQSILGVINKYDGVPHREAKKPSVATYTVDAEKVESLYNKLDELESLPFVWDESPGQFIAGLWMDFSDAVNGGTQNGYDIATRLIRMYDEPDYITISVALTDGKEVATAPMVWSEFLSRDKVGEWLTLKEVTDVLTKIVNTANSLTSGSTVSHLYTTSDPVVSVANITEDEKADWMYEVANGDTTLGLEAWAGHSREAAGESTDSIQVSHIGLDYGTVSVTRDGEETEYEVSLGLAHALKNHLGSR